VEKVNEETEDTKGRTTYQYEGQFKTGPLIAFVIVAGALLAGAYLLF